MNNETGNSGERAMNNNRTRASLLLRVRDLQDRESWEEFLELYGPLILRYLRRTGVAQQDAVDLTQDVLQMVVKHIGSFEYDPGRSFRAWLRTIARNRAYRFFEQQSRRPQSPGGSEHAMAIQQTPTDDPIQDELIEKEWRRRCRELAIKQVRPRVKVGTWRVFELHMEGLSRSEISERLGMRVGAVYTSLCRVKKRLQEAVEEIDE